MEGRLRRLRRLRLLLLLLLVLGRDRRYWRGASLEALLRLALARETGILLLQRLRLGLLLLRKAGRLNLHRVAGVLLLERLWLSEASGLRCKWARLLASWRHVVEGGPILLLRLAAWTLLIVGAQEGIGVGIHGELLPPSGLVRIGEGVVWA